MIQAPQIRALLDAHFPARYLDHLPVLYYGRTETAFVGYAASDRGADRLIGASGRACLYVSRAKMLDGREFFIGHN